MKIKEDGERKTSIEKKNYNISKTEIVFFLNLNNEWKTNDLCLDVLKIILKKSELNGNKIVGQLQ